MLFGFTSDAQIFCEKLPQANSSILEKLNSLPFENKILEASGKITKSSILEIAKTGVNLISSGWLTHSSPSLDIGLDFS